MSSPRSADHSAPGDSAYDADYAAVSRAKRLADDHGVAVVLVHHVRKAGSDDFLTEVSGTNGLAGAADATLVLKRSRGSADGILHVTGRDIDEAEYALAFQPASGAWHLLDGLAEEHNLPETRAAILRYVRAIPTAAEGDLRRASASTATTSERTCQRMATDGQLAGDTTRPLPRMPPSRKSAGNSGTVPPSPLSLELPLTCDDGPRTRGTADRHPVPAVPRITRRRKAFRMRQAERLIPSRRSVKTSGSAGRPSTTGGPKVAGLAASSSPTGRSACAAPSGTLARHKGGGSMMVTCYDVRIWKVEPYKGKNVTTYRARWVVDGKRFGEYFATAALADNFRAQLVTASRRGEAFDTASGLPVSMTKADRDMNWLDFACKYVDTKWKDAAPTTGGASPRGLCRSPSLLSPASSTVGPKAGFSGGHFGGGRSTRRAERRRCHLQSPKRCHGCAETVGACQRSLSPTSSGRCSTRWRSTSTASPRRRTTSTADGQSCTTHSSTPSSCGSSMPIPCARSLTPGSSPKKVRTTVDKRSVVNPDQAAALLKAVGGDPTEWTTAQGVLRGHVLRRPPA